MHLCNQKIMCGCLFFPKNGTPPHVTLQQKTKKHTSTMTYIEIINRFWKIHQFDHFSSAEIAVYFYLLNMANRNMWEDEIAVATAELCASIGMRRSTIIRARQSLREKGLIECREGVRNSRTPVYRIVTSATTKATTKTTTKPTTKETLYKDKDIDKENISLSTEEKPIDEIEKILVADHNWQTDVVKLTEKHRGPAQTAELLPFIHEFFGYLRSCGVRTKTVDDCRAHFVNKMNREYIKTFNKHKCKTFKQDFYENQRPIEAPADGTDAYDAPF